MKKFLVYTLAVSIVISAAYFRFVYWRKLDINKNDNNIENVINNNPYDNFIVNASDFFDKSNKYDFYGNITQLSPEIKSNADKIAEKYAAVGVQIAVIKNKELLYTYEYGYADSDAKKSVTPETKFRVASLAKFVTDSVFMKLCDLGIVSINGDISSYLGFTVRNPHFPDVAITPAMLMSHTSTILNSGEFEISRSEESSIPIEEILSYDHAFYNAQPGTYYAYSNFGVAILGAICERVTGMYFNDLVKMYFFNPLNIDASYLASELHEPELLANIYGWEGLSVEAQMGASKNPILGRTHHLVQGNLLISAKDYAKFIAMICAGGLTEDSVRLLSRSSVDEMYVSRIYAEGLGSGFGIEENKNLIKDKVLYSHTGNSYGMYSAYIFDPQSGNGIVVLTSGANVQYIDDAGIYDITQDYFKLLFPQ